MSWHAKNFNNELAEACDSFDLDGAQHLCTKLVEHIRKRDDPYPIDHCKIVLKQLRGKRYFTLMQNVADALTKSLPAPSFTKHHTYLFGSRIPFEAFRVELLHHRLSKERVCWLAHSARVVGA